MGIRAKLDANESPWPPPTAIRAMLLSLLDTSNRYPADAGNLLVDALARQLALPSEQIFVGAGSAALCQAILLWRRGDGGRVYVSEPSYEGYAKLAGQLGLTVVRIPLRENMHDLEHIQKHLRAGDRSTVFLCNPNNPTGTFVSPSNVRRFVKRAPRDALVVLDEAYIEYVSDDVHQSLALISDHDNVVVLRTFSKAYGLAGLRAAYGISNSVSAELIRSYILAYSVTRLAEVAGCFSIGAGVDATQRESIKRLRATMIAELRALGYAVPDSKSNFVWIPLGKLTEDFGRTCVASRVSVKVYDRLGVRVSVGSEEEVQLFLSVARTFNQGI